jgi:2-phosphosulfolactate phosphatase
MKLDVALLPRLLSDPEASVCVVIDALRASTSAVALLAGGAQEIVVAESPSAARRIARQEPRRYVLAGEENGLAPRGFDYGNSPSEFAALDIKGQRFILSTTNGTRALQRLAASPLVLVGALVNASAAVRMLLAEAEARRLNAALVCAGLSQGKRLSLEDAIAAGALVDTALKTARSRASLDLTDGALIAHRLYRSYRGDALAAFRRSEHGRSLIALGFAPDLEFCARADRFDTVPRLRREPSGRLTLFVEKM